MIFKRLVDGVCAPAERRLDGRIRRVWAWLLGLFGVGLVLCLAGCVSLKSENSRDPNGAKVSPATYTEQFRSAYWTAAARLEGLGYSPLNRIKTVEIVTDGLVKGQSGKYGFPSPCSSTGVAGGTSTPTSIKAAAPGGVLDTDALIHECAHCILYAHGNYDTADHHAIISKAKL